MGLTGKQKAAMLLMSLDAATAAELLKGIDPQVVQELAVELAYLDTAGHRSSKQSMELARQFYNSLRPKEEEFHLNSFLKEMLRSTVGSDKAEQIQNRIHDLLRQRDPFISIRSADSRTLASVLESEHPQAAAVVLSELSAKKGSEVLGFLGEGIRISAIRRMTSCDTVAAEAKARIAEMVWKRIEAAKSSEAGTAIQTRPEQSLRKVAVMLRSLGKELRDGLLGALRGKNDKAGEMVANLMIVWEDIPQVADRPLQEALRGIEARKLALALYKADETITSKIRSNISERAAATVDEETSLMSTPKKKDIEDAREEIVRILREMNEKGNLSFVEE
jgi:flagellar motor switch protein FliG